MDAELISNLKSLASEKVKKLKAPIANALLICIIQAIIVNDDLEETINSTLTDTEHADDEDASDADDDDDGDDEKSVHENENDKTVIEIKTVDPGLGTSKQALMADSKADKFIPKKVGTKAQKTCIGKINKKLEISNFLLNFTSNLRFSSF